jgi:exodeoxyribonuclease VII large subunit
MPTTATAATLLDFTRDIWTVSRLNREARAVLEGSFPLLWVQGELSNLAQPASGHIYFSLKDEAAQVRCAMFRQRRNLLRFRPVNGDQVLVRARIGLYESRGDFQLIVEHMEPAGEGALRLELERRKQRLAAEGLFDEAAKRPLPPLPHRIGLITSASGAAVHDMLTVLGRRFPLLPVLIYPAQVQGDGAAESLIAALERANRHADCDLLLIGRGGGSLEDLMAFNDEGLVRAIRASLIPVVSGIGHEVDLTLADLAADRRGATPSAAAELASPSAEHLAHRIEALAVRLATAEQRGLDQARRALQSAERHLRLLHPAARLQQQAQRVDQQEQRLQAAIRAQLQRHRLRLAPLMGRVSAGSPAPRLARGQDQVRALAGRLQRAVVVGLADRRRRLAQVVDGLDARSPLATLARGYAIVTREADGALVSRPEQAPAGTALKVRLREGTLAARVEDRCSEHSADPKRR